MLNQADLDKIYGQIKNQFAEFLKWSDGKEFRAFYRVKIFGEKFIVLYDLEIDTLTTILYNSWLKLVDDEWVSRRKWRKGRKQSDLEIEHKEDIINSKFKFKRKNEK